MATRLWTLIRLLLSGALLFGSSASGCVADALRDAAEGIDDRDTSLSDVGDSIDDWWDDLWD